MYKTPIDEQLFAILLCCVYKSHTFKYGIGQIRSAISGGSGRVHLSPKKCLYLYMIQTRFRYLFCLMKLCDSPSMS